MKNFGLNQTIVRNASLKLAIFAVLCGLLVKGLEYFIGIVPALILVATLGALIPLHMERKRLAIKAHRRFLAMLAIQDLKESIFIYREWFPCHVSLEEMKARFSLATDRAEAVRQMLKARVRHLDRCEADGSTPTPGAGWRELRQIARKLTSEVEGAAWICEHGVSPNPGLLAPDWSDDYGINTDPAKASENNKEEVPERTVVPMDEFEHLRKNRYTHGGAGTLVYISGEGEANQN